MPCCPHQAAMRSVQRSSAAVANESLSFGGTGAPILERSWPAPAPRDNERIWPPRLPAVLSGPAPYYVPVRFSASRRLLLPCCPHLSSVRPSTAVLPSFACGAGVTPGSTDGQSCHCFSLVLPWGLERSACIECEGFKGRLLLGLPRAMPAANTGWPFAAKPLPVPAGALGHLGI